MITRGEAIYVHYQARNTSSSTGETGDVANHTLQVVLDGNIAAAANTPDELGDGLYGILLTAAETNGLIITLGGVSSTADVYIIPVHFVTTDNTRSIELNMQYSAWNITNNTPKTGDVANHTINVATGDTTAAATNTPTEISAALIPGVYNILLTTTETSEPIDTVYGTSATSDIIIIPTNIPTGRKYSVTTSSTDTLRQRIVDVLTTRLATITELNGYKTDVGNSIHRWDGFALSESQLPAIEYKDTDDFADQETIGRVEHDLTIEFNLISTRNKASEEAAAEQEIRKIIADLNQMVGTDIRWSDLAEDTELIDDSMDMSQLENKQWAATVSITIIYRSDRFDSYQ